MKMTKEEALEFGNMWLQVNEDCKDSNTYAFFQIAIQALEQQPCEDAISRQAVIDATVKKNSIWNSITNSKGENLEEILSQLPSVTPQPKTGHWIVNEHGSIYCSECGCGALYDKVYPGESVFGKAIRVKSTFCPTCGAKMVEPQESEE